jgi:hypothetical protein
MPLLVWLSYTTPLLNWTWIFHLVPSYQLLNLTWTWFFVDHGPNSPVSRSSTTDPDCFSHKLRHDWFLSVRWMFPIFCWTASFESPFLFLSTAVFYHSTLWIGPSSQSKKLSASLFIWCSYYNSPLEQTIFFYLSGTNGSRLRLKNCPCRYPFQQPKGCRAIITSEWVLYFTGCISSHSLSVYTPIQFIQTTALQSRPFRNWQGYFIGWSFTGKYLSNKFLY